jgi:hypothetical protein
MNETTEVIETAPTDTDDMSNSPMLPADSDLVHAEELELDAVESGDNTEELLECTTASSPIPVIKTVGLATVKMYIAAIVDLFNEQCMADPL